MTGRFQPTIGDSGSYRCELCKDFFKVLIQTKDAVSCCVNCYEKKFGKEVTKEAIAKLPEDYKKTARSPLPERDLSDFELTNELFNNSYKLFKYRETITDVFEVAKDIGLSDEEHMQCFDFLERLKELTSDEIQNVGRKLANLDSLTNSVRLPQLMEMVESSNQYALKEKYGMCTRCLVRPLKDAKKSRTEDIEICSQCAMEEVAKDLENRPEMTREQYEEFYESVKDSLPSKHMDFLRSLIDEEIKRGTPNDLIENIIMQRLHHIEKHPVDFKGWCHYCHAFFRSSLIPDEIRASLESCPACVNIVQRQELPNELIGQHLRSHIKRQHKDIYKKIKAPDSDYYQWDFITPEEDERRRAKRFFEQNPDADSEDYEKERTKFIKKHYPMTRIEPNEEDPSSIFPAMDEYTMAPKNLDIDPQVFHKAKKESEAVARLFTEKLMKLDKEMDDFLREKGASEQWINSLRSRIQSMKPEQVLGLKEDLEEHFLKHATGQKINPERPVANNLAKDMLACTVCTEISQDARRGNIDANEYNQKFRAHIIEKHPEFCIYIGNGTDKDFKTLVHYTDDSEEQKIADKILRAFYLKLTKTKKQTIPRAEYTSWLGQIVTSGFESEGHPPDTKSEFFHKVMRIVKLDIDSRLEFTSYDPSKKLKPRKSGEYKPRKEYAKYEDFQKFLKDNNIKSIRDFIRFTETEQVPENIPKTLKSAEGYYRHQQVWKGWSSACGIQRKEAMTREKIDEILDHILENFEAFMSLSDALLLYWFDSFGLFGTKDPLKNAFFKNFIEWKDQEQGRKALYEWLTDRDFEKEHYGFTLVQKTDETREDFLSRQYASTKPKKEHLFRTTTESIDDILHSSKTFDPVDYKKNPKLFSIFVDFVVDRLMMSYIDNQNQQFNMKKNGQKFNDTVIDRFKDMRKIIKKLDYKQKEYKGLEPTLLQCYGVYKARKKLGFLNMFGTGTGKTKIGFMLAKHIGAKRVFWVSPYNVVNQTNEMCLTDYPDSITTSVLDNKKNKRIPDSYINDQTSQKKTRFHFINYEKFNNKTNGKSIINQLNDTKIDLIVLDEGQRVKSRKDESNVTERTSKSSNTRQNVLELVRQLRKKNPNMKVLVLTATPIINSIREAMSIYEILTSSTLNMSGANNIKNGMRMYVELLPYSVRFEQKYDIDIIQKPIVCEGFLPDNMSEETGQKLSWLEIEQIATKYRIPPMLEEAKRIMKEDPNAKILIYTDLKTGIIDQLVEAFGEHKEFKIGIFSGDDKTGMVKDLGFVDGKRKFFNPFVKGDVNLLIATRSIAVGIDGIQSVCNHIFFNGLVWTWADFEQIRGRLVRTGQIKDKVFVNMFFSTINGYPYDLNLKYKRIIRKKGLGELVRDGRLPKDIDTGVTKQEKKDFIETCFKNRISGFPTKEELELKHSEIAQQQIETDVEELQEEFPEIDNGGFNNE